MGPERRCGPPRPLHSGRRPYEMAPARTRREMLLMQGPEQKPPDASATEGIGDLFSSIREVFTHPENTAKDLFLAAGVAVAVLIVLLVIRAVVSSRIASFAAKTSTRGDHLAAAIVRRTSWVFLLIVSFYPASQLLHISENVRAAHAKLLVLALIFQAALWANGIITFMLAVPEDATDKQQATARLLQSIGFLCRLGIWAVAGLFALANFGVDISVILAGGTIGGLAIAFAFQSILKDLFSSLSIILDKPFEVGDYLVVGDLSGTVERVGLQTTRMKSLTGEQIVFHNGDLLSSRLRNYKHMKERRVSFTIGVTYGTPAVQLDAIPGMIEKIVDLEETARFDRCHFKTLASSSFDFDTVFYMKVPEYASYLDVQQRINLAIVRKFEEEKIEFAYPTQTIFLEGALPGGS